MIESAVGVCTVIEYDAVATWLVGSEESLTCTAKGKVPVCSGIPVICPEFGFRTSPKPDGSPVSLHVYGVTPPEAAMEALYLPFVNPAGRGPVVVIESGVGGWTVIENCCVTESGGIELSLNFTVNVDVIGLLPTVGAEGVPTIVPD